MEKRQLKKGAAGWVLLAGLGVAYVISGDFAGWNFGLAEGGWGGLLIATILMATMYTCMVFALAELSSTISTAGGGYGFGRRALGPWGGFLTGTAILIEYALAPAAIVTFIGAYVEALDIGISAGWPVYLVFYAVFVGIHLVGVGEALKVTFVITAIAVVALLVFVVAIIPEFSTSNLTDIPPDGSSGSSDFLPFGWDGIWAAFPYAIWFFLAIEGVPLAAEETRDPKKDMPRGLIAGMGVLLVFAALMLFFAPGGSGSEAIIGIGQPAGRRADRGRRRQRRDRLRELGRPVRPDRELLLDHLRLLAPAVRALARGLLPARAVGDQRPQGAVDRARAAGARRLPPGRLLGGPGRADPQHRRVRRRRVVRADDALAHRPALARAGPRARVHARRAARRPRAWRSCSRCSRWSPRSSSTPRRRSSRSASTPRRPLYFGLYSRHHLVGAAPEEEFAAIESAEAELAGH